MNRLERSALARWSLLIAGLVLPQVLLYGQCLIGERVLLPVDLLTLPSVYLPPEPGERPPRPHAGILTDVIYLFQPDRLFVAEQLRAGHFPLWDSNTYTGAPYPRTVAYDPFEWLFFLFPIPATLAWIELLRATISGIGAYLFFRHTLKVRLDAALVGAWCFPLMGYFIFWQGNPHPHPVRWLPWLCFAVASVVRRPGGWGGPLLALFTLLSVSAWQTDITVLVLGAVGLFAVWELIENSTHPFQPKVLVRGVCSLALGWGIGLALSAPYLLPLTAYANTSARLEQRNAGVKEPPPVGFSVLPQVVIAEYYGTTRSGVFLNPEAANQLESTGTAYAGLIAALFAAPLAWQRQTRRQAWFWLGMAVIGIAWPLNVIGLVDVMKLPGLLLFPFQRFGFLTGFAILTLAVIGLDRASEFRHGSRWAYAGIAGLSVFAVVCLARVLESPAGLFGRLPEAVVKSAKSATDEQLQAFFSHVGGEFRQTFTLAFLACLAAIAGWVLLLLGRASRPWFVPVVGSAMLVELLGTAWDVFPQCDPALNYPKLPFAAKLAEAPPGRALGVACLPPNLLRTLHLRDVRGYDGIDPRPMVELLSPLHDPRVPMPSYTALSFFVPKIQAGKEGTIKLHPILDMLGVRYLIFRGNPSKDARPYLNEKGYWVAENSAALPRAFVPKRVEVLPTGQPTLDRLTRMDFNPREVAFVSNAIDVPATAVGRADETDDGPNAVVVNAHMETPGLLVLADQWHEGWSATVNGVPAEVLRVNHALRGVKLPAGESTVRFQYRPPSLTRGLWLASLGGVCLVVWCGYVVRRRGGMVCQ